MKLCSLVWMAVFGSLVCLLLASQQPQSSMVEAHKKHSHGHVKIKVWRGPSHGHKKHKYAPFKYHFSIDEKGY